MPAACQGRRATLLLARMRWSSKSMESAAAARIYSFASSCLPADSRTLPRILTSVSDPSTNTAPEAQDVVRALACDDGHAGLTPAHEDFHRSASSPRSTSRTKLDTSQQPPSSPKRCTPVRLCPRPVSCLLGGLCTSSWWPTHCIPVTGIQARYAHLKDGSLRDADA